MQWTSQIIVFIMITTGHEIQQMREYIFRVQLYFLFSLHVNTAAPQQSFLKYVLCFWFYWTPLSLIMGWTLSTKTSMLQSNTSSDHNKTGCILLTSKPVSLEQMLILHHWCSLNVLYYSLVDYISFMLCWLFECQGVMAQKCSLLPSLNIISVLVVH